VIIICYVYASTIVIFIYCCAAMSNILYGIIVVYVAVAYGMMYALMYA